MTIGNRPTGLGLQREVYAYLARTGMLQREFSRGAGLAEQTISNLSRVAFPLMVTVKAVRTFIEAYPDGVPSEQLAALKPKPLQQPGGANAVEYARASSLAPPTTVVSAEHARAADAAPRMTTREAVATALVETPGDLIATVKRRWPEHWDAVLMKARAADVSPAAMLDRVIASGLRVA